MLPLVWPLPRSLATTSGISFDFSSSPYLDVSVQAVPFLRLFDSTQDLWAFPTGVSPFGYLRIKTHLQLPAAFRSLSRPSSAPSAKAFPLRSFLLDQSWFSQELLWQPLSAFIVIFHYPFAKTEKPLNCPFKCLLYRCLFFSFVQFSMCSFLWGQAPWWRRTESNCRPPACKAGALPAELRPHIPSVGLSSLSPPFPSSENGGPKWTRTTDLTIISRAL